MLLVSITCSLETFPSPEAALLKSHVVWPDQFSGLAQTPEVHDSRTSHQTWQIWLAENRTYSAHVQKIGSGRSSRFLVLNKRNAAPGNENGLQNPSRITNHYPVVWLFSEKRLEAIKTYQRETVLQKFVLNLIWSRAYSIEEITSSLLY